MAATRRKDAGQFRAQQRSPAQGYEVTGKAPSEVEAVRLADETLEYVERIDIRDHMRDDGTTLHPPASSRSTAYGQTRRHQVSAS